VVAYQALQVDGSSSQQLPPNIQFTSSPASNAEGSPNGQVSNAPCTSSTLTLPQQAVPKFSYRRQLAGSELAGVKRVSAPEFSFLRMPLIGLLQPLVTAFSGPNPGSSSPPSGSPDPGCGDPDVVAFLEDVNAQTPQASNGGLPNCNLPPASPFINSPPPPPPPVPPAGDYAIALIENHFPDS
jgi:hypothetical protein